MFKLAILVVDCAPRMRDVYLTRQTLGPRPPFKSKLWSSQDSKQTIVA